jgi:hypothetical protein
MEHLGKLIKNLAQLHDLEFKIHFGIHSNTFFQKLVNENLLGEKGVYIKPDVFYKGLLFLDYFCGIIEGDYYTSEKLVALSKAIRDQERNKKLDKQLNYLGLELIVNIAGLVSQKREGDYYSVSNAEIRQRHEKEQAIDLDSESARKGEPYYDAMGKLVYDLAGAERQKHLNNVARRTDIHAVVFVDCVLEYLRDDACRKQADELLSRNDYLAASLKALEGLRKQVTREHVDKLIPEVK